MHSCEGRGFLGVEWNSECLCKMGSTEVFGGLESIRLLATALYLSELALMWISFQNDQQTWLCTKNYTTQPHNPPPPLEPLCQLCHGNIVPAWDPYSGTHRQQGSPLPSPPVLFHIMLPCKHVCPAKPAVPVSILTWPPPCPALCRFSGLAGATSDPGPPSVPCLFQTPALERNRTAKMSRSF